MQQAVPSLGLSFSRNSLARGRQVVPPRARAFRRLCPRVGAALAGRQRESKNDLQARSTTTNRASSAGHLPSLLPASPPPHLPKQAKRAPSPAPHSPRLAPPSAHDAPVPLPVRPRPASAPRRRPAGLQRLHRRVLHLLVLRQEPVCGSRVGGSSARRGGREGEGEGEGQEGEGGGGRGLMRRTPSEPGPRSPSSRSRAPARPSCPPRRAGPCSCSRPRPREGGPPPCPSAPARGLRGRDGVQKAQAR